MSTPIGLSTPARRPDPPGWRWAWHGWANAVVLGWLLAAVGAGLGLGGAPAWLAVHLFLLGAATTAIMVWSEHFTVALLHAAAPGRRAAAGRLGVLTAGQLGVLAGVVADAVPLLAAGAVLVTAAVAAHGRVLLRLRRAALGGRLAGLVDFYLAACAALLLGAPLGGLLGAGVGGEAWHERLHAAHAHLNVGGWVLLTVLGTLFMLWPTTIGVRMADGTAAAARRCLRLAVPGLATTVAGLLLELRPLAVAGLVLYAAGVAVALVPFVVTLRSRRPANGPAWMLAAPVGWLLLSVAVDAVAVARGASPPDVLGPLLLAGVVGQLLVGSLTYLLPVMLGGGPAAVRAANAHLGRGWPVRVALLNVGVAGWAAAPAGPAAVAGTAGRLLVFAVAVEFVVRAARLVVPRLPGLGGGRAPAVAGVGLGAALTALAVGLAFSGTDPTVPAAPGGHAHGGGAAAGVRTVDVELSGMRVRPGVVEVPAGTRLRLRVVNTDAQGHDLRLSGGARTPVLRRGERAELDVGVVRGEVKAWCAVPGHRAAGMALTIRPAGGAAVAAPGQPADHRAAGGPGWDPAAPFAADFTARDPALAPPPTGTLHRVELPVVEKELEVAPGVRQRMWTFGGTVPGPTLRGKLGDEFEVTLVNSGSLGHGIDFHAGATAPDGVMRTIQPGERLVYRFRADRAGAWLYHCSTMPMTQHLAAGMFGAVVVDPPDAAPVQREYLLVAGELYLGEPGGDGVTAALRAGTPAGWVFNGAANQYDRAPLTARVGERVRIWVVSAGPGSTTAFHVVGARFDTVYKEGGYLLRPGAGAAQVLDLAPAQGGFVEMVFGEPGRYPVVDHDLRHAEAGAHGVVAVTP